MRYCSLWNCLKHFVHVLHLVLPQSVNLQHVGLHPLRKRRNNFQVAELATNETTQKSAGETAFGDIVSHDSSIETRLGNASVSPYLLGLAVLVPFSDRIAIVACYYWSLLLQCSTQTFDARTSEFYYDTIIFILKLRLEHSQYGQSRTYNSHKN